MADSVTNVQIEDVLSSIRKLVSEEVRAQTRDATLQRRADDRPAPPASDDRLLLTPALRVQPDARPAEEIEEAPEAPFTHAESLPELREEADLLDLMARVRAAGNRPAAEDKRPEIMRPDGIAAVIRPAPLPQTAQEETLAITSIEETIHAVTRAAHTGEAEEITGLDDFEADDLFAEARDFDDASEFEDAVAFTAPDDAPEEEAATDRIVPRFLHRSGVTSLGQRIAEVESVVSTSGAEFELEADEEGDAAPEPLRASVPWETRSDDTAPRVFHRRGQTQPEPEEDDIGDDDWSVEPDPVERDFIEAAEPEQDILARSDAAEDDAPEEAPEEGLDAAALGDWEDADLDDDDLYLTTEADRQTLAADDPTVIDEEMLRDLVAEIVRQELQGALGERITRNVRKLVRREIHRALSAQDLA